jgi:hypothetical protein
MKFKAWVSRLIYRNKVQTIFCDDQFGIIERHYNLKYIPQKGSLVLPTDSNEYHVVTRIIHKLDTPYTIWVIINQA